MTFSHITDCPHLLQYFFMNLYTPAKLHHSQFPDSICIFHMFYALPQSQMFLFTHSIKIMFSLPKGKFKCDIIVHEKFLITLGIINFFYIFTTGTLHFCLPFIFMPYIILNYLYHLQLNSEDHGKTFSNSPLNLT